MRRETIPLQFYESTKTIRSNRSLPDSTNRYSTRLFHHTPLSIPLVIQICSTSNSTEISKLTSFNSLFTIVIIGSIIPDTINCLFIFSSIPFIRQIQPVFRMVVRNPQNARICTMSYFSTYFLKVNRIRCDSNVAYTEATLHVSSFPTIRKKRLEERKNASRGHRRVAIHQEVRHDLQHGGGVKSHQEIAV